MGLFRVLSNLASGGTVDRVNITAITDELKKLGLVGVNQATNFLKQNQDTIRTGSNGVVEYVFYNLIEELERSYTPGLRTLGFGTDTIFLERLMGHPSPGYMGIYRNGNLNEIFMLQFPIDIPNENVSAEFTEEDYIFQNVHLYRAKSPTLKFKATTHFVATDTEVHNSYWVEQKKRKMESFVFPNIDVKEHNIHSVPVIGLFLSDMFFRPRPYVVNYLDNKNLLDGDRYQDVTTAIYWISLLFPAIVYEPIFFKLNSVNVSYDFGLDLNENSPSIFSPLGQVSNIVSDASSVFGAPNFTKGNPNKLPMGVKVDLDFSEFRTPVDVVTANHIQYSAGTSTMFTKLVDIAVNAINGNLATLR